MSAPDTERLDAIVPYAEDYPMRLSLAFAALDNMRAELTAAREQTETLREALRRVANGPWPNGFMADAQTYARAALDGEQ